MRTILETITEFPINISVHLFMIPLNMQKKGDPHHILDKATMFIIFTGVVQNLCHCYPVYMIDKIFSHALWLSLVLLGVCPAQWGCSKQSNDCMTDSDCMTGFICVSKVCYQKKADEWDGGEPGSDPGDPGTDPGSDPGFDGGSDPGTDNGADMGTDKGADTGGDNGQDWWSIIPSVGIGPALVSQGISSPHTLAEARAALFEQGQPLQNAPFTLSFRNDTVWVSGIDANGNQTFDDPDLVLSIVARPGLNARTQQGLVTGNSRAQVLATPAYTSPDHTAILEPSGQQQGGKVDEYFNAGIFFGYDQQDLVNAITVTRSYRPPKATIIPEEAKLTFGTNGSVFCGDGYTTGSKQNLHRSILGDPDMHSTYQQEITLSDGTNITIDFYIDSYRIQGMEFVGGDDTYLWYDIDRLVSIMLYPLFYGTTDGGNGIGSTRAMWQNEFGAPVEIKENTEYNTKTYIYQAGSKGLAILYTNNGESFDDRATWIMLNVKLPDRTSTGMDVPVRPGRYPTPPVSMADKD